MNYIRDVRSKNSPVWEHKWKLEEEDQKDSILKIDVNMNCAN